MENTSEDTHFQTVHLFIASIQTVGYIYIVQKELQLLQLLFSFINKTEMEYGFQGI